MFETLEPKIVYILFAVVILLLIYGIARTEQIWTHLKYEKQIKDIRNEAIIEAKK